MKWCIVVVWGMVFIVVTGKSSAMSREEKGQMREKVLEMFNHAYNSYMRYAYPADELMPLTCKGRVRGVDPSRGDVDDALGRFSLTLIDTLDTLAVIGEVAEFEKAVKLVIRDVTFDSDVVVSVFETNIRVVGGLLGGHVAAVSLKNAGHGMSWYKGELLTMASDVGYRLLPAFNTSTGMPYPRVNLRYGIHHPESNTGSEQDTCTACAGTMILEFGALSRLTGDPVFEAKAHKAMEAIWMYRSRATDLVGTVINIHNGDWVRRDSGVGAGIDSYYEYCLKGYILLGDEVYLERFNRHYKSIMQYINQGPMFLSVQMHQPERTAHAYMDALQAFWPGLQVLKGDLHKAIETHQMLFEVAKKHTFLPEAFTTDFEVHWAQHPLRPELVESTYFLYEATGDPYYLEVGKTIIEKLNEHARVPCGFAAVKDVRTLSHEDRMDSFVLAETFKYLYLLFTDKQDLTLDMHKFLFTTEAHLLPLHLSTVTVNETATQQLRYNVTLSPENEHEYTCPYNKHDGGKAKFAQEIRRKVQPKPQGSCPNKPSVPYQPKIKRVLRLRAEQFVPSNKKHLEILKTMGISVVQTKEGRIQLMHTASSAFTQEDAEDGIVFMQEMIELAKQRNEEDAIGQNPRVVQLMSPPYSGNIALNAGPAQFGLDLTKGDVGVGAEIALGVPYKGCAAFTNQEELKHRIVILGRGECMFIDKVRQAESAGAVGVVIIDDHEGSSSDQQPVFAMSGDGSSSNVKIPAVFLFYQEGEVLLKAVEAQEDINKRLRIRLAAKASGAKSKKGKPKSGQAESKSISGETERERTTPKTGEEAVEAITSKDGDLDRNPSNSANRGNSPEGSSAEGGIRSTENHQSAVPRSHQVVLGKDEVFCPGLGEPCPKEPAVNPAEMSSETPLETKDLKLKVKKVHFDYQKYNDDPSTEFPNWASVKLETPTKKEDHHISYTVIDDTVSQESSQPSVNRDNNHSNDNEGRSQRTADETSSKQTQDDSKQEFEKELYADEAGCK